MEIQELVKKQRAFYATGATRPVALLMCDKEVIEVQKILPFLSGT